jgi:hypothetical protein
LPSEKPVAVVTGAARVLSLPGDVADEDAVRGMVERFGRVHVLLIRANPQNQGKSGSLPCLPRAALSA